MAKHIVRHLQFVILLMLSLAATTAGAQMLCVWDPLGSQGDYSTMLKDYQLAAKRWGVQLEVSFYTDEAKSVEDFKGSKCDMLNMIGFRARLFNPATGTLEAPGAIENYAQMRDVLGALASPKAAKLMLAGNYEVTGIVPIGAGYPFVIDRKINGLGPVRGKKIAIMSWDPLQALLVNQVGAVPTPLEFTQFASKFNSGAVDIMIAPMALYKPLELSKGIGNHGGIIHRPMLQFTLQLMAKHDKFPPGFGQSSREYMLTQLNYALGVIHNQESAVDQSQWIYANTAELRDYNRIMREARAHLTAAGYYDRRMLNLLKRVRCKGQTDAVECGPDEE